MTASMTADRCVRSGAQPPGTHRADGRPWATPAARRAAVALDMPLADPGRTGPVRLRDVLAAATPAPALWSHARLLWFDADDDRISRLARIAWAVIESLQAAPAPPVGPIDLVWSPDPGAPAQSVVSDARSLAPEQLAERWPTRSPEHVGGMVALHESVPASVGPIARAGSLVVVTATEPRLEVVALESAGGPAIAARSAVALGFSLRSDRLGWGAAPYMVEAVRHRLLAARHG